MVARTQFAKLGLFHAQASGVEFRELQSFTDAFAAVAAMEGRDWTWLGKWAARADDALSWLPARLTVVLLAVAAWQWPTGLGGEARRTPSPNSGWPMATMALLLGVRLAKPGVYALNAEGRQATALDTQRTALLGGRAVLAMAVCATAVIVSSARWA